MDEHARRAAAAELSKHRRLLTSARDGRVLSALMMPMVRWSPPAGQGVLTTIGRRTGTPRAKVVRVIRRDECAYVVALQPPNMTLERPGRVNAWVLNIRADPSVQLRIRGGTYDGVAREIADPVELDTARALLCDTVFPIDYGECVLHLRGLPTPTKIRELHRYWFLTGTPVAIDLRESA